MSERNRLRMLLSRSKSSLIMAIAKLLLLFGGGVVLGVGEIFSVGCMLGSLLIVGRGVSKIVGVGLLLGISEMLLVGVVVLVGASETATVGVG